MAIPTAVQDTTTGVNHKAWVVSTAADGDNGEVLVDPGIHNGYDTAAIAAGLTGLAGLLAAAPAAIISKKSWPAMALAAGGTGTMLAGAGLNRIAHKNRQYQGNHQPMDEALSGFHGLSNYRSAP